MCSSQLVVGARFGRGRYELREAIATGGTSVVHVVYDRRMDRRVAGKFVLDAENQKGNPARSEARATARLQHPNIVMVHDVGVWGNIPYLTMELLEGRTLAEELAQGPLAPTTALSVLLSIACALEHAHARGVFHLDLKPGNVHVGHNGSVKLLDFGVGSDRGLATPPGSGTAELMVVGTPGYMAPEQWNAGPVDARADIWALGVLLYEALCGELPSNGQHPGYCLASGKAFSVPSVSSALNLPVEVDRLLSGALVVEPSRRFQSVAELLQILRPLLRSTLGWTRTERATTERHLSAVRDLAQEELLSDESWAVEPAPSAAFELLKAVRMTTLQALRANSRKRALVRHRSLTRTCLERLSVQELSTVVAHLLESQPMVVRSCTPSQDVGRTCRAASQRRAHALTQRRATEATLSTPSRQPCGCLGGPCCSMAAVSTRGRCKESAAE